MDLFITKIQLKQHIKVEDIYNLIKCWAEESPHYKIKIDYDLKYDHYKQDFGGVSITFLNSCFNGDKVFACHFENKEADNIWITDYIQVIKENENNLFINLSCKSQGYANKLPRQHKPHLIKMLMDKNYCIEEGIFPISDKPIFPSEDKVDMCSAIMNGEQETPLPVVYVSLIPYTKAKNLYFVDVNRLAVKLSGVAHVVVEPNDKFAHKIWQVANHCNSYNGFIGIYFPNSKYREIVSPYLNDKKLNEKELENYINELVLQSCINHANISDWNWSTLLIEYNKRKFEAQKIQADDTIKESQELEELVNAYAQDKEELKDKVNELQKQLDNKTIQLEILKAKCDDKKLITFNFDGIEEFYTHEMHDAVLYALKYYGERVSKDSRVNELLSQLLEKNTITGCGDSLITDIKDAVKEKSIDKRRSKFENCGFTIERGSHDKLLFNGDEKYLFIMSNSPSDHRSNSNFLSEIKNKIDISKKF